MKVIHVLRKPLTGTVAANVLAHGTGALNIDATRIRTGQNEPDSGAMFYKNRGLSMPENRQNYFGQAERTVQCEPLVGGRWPANFILSHSPSCVEQDTDLWACVSGCPVRAMDVFGDTGGASRFFKQFKALEKP